MNTAGWTISIIAIVIALVVAFRWERSSGGSTDDLRDATGAAFEFMSPSWIAMARREITRALSRQDLDVEPFTLSEEFTDPPAHLARGAGTIGFAVRIGHGDVEVVDHPSADADVRVISVYADALELARDPDAASADPDEARRRLAEGRLRIEGDPTGMPDQLQALDIHRLLARHTA